MKNPDTWKLHKTTHTTWARFLDAMPMFVHSLRPSDHLCVKPEKTHDRIEARRHAPLVGRRRPERDDQTEHRTEHCEHLVRNEH